LEDQGKGGRTHLGIVPCCGRRMRRATRGQSTTLQAARLLRAITCVPYIVSRLHSCHNLTDGSFFTSVYREVAASRTMCSRPHRTAISYRSLSLRADPTAFFSLFFHEALQLFSSRAIAPGGPHHPQPIDLYADVPRGRLECGMQPGGRTLVT
jgi:hypothetical protein